MAKKYPQHNLSGGSIQQSSHIGYGALNLSVVSGSCTPDGEFDVWVGSTNANLTINNPINLPVETRKILMAIKNTGATDINLSFGSNFRYGSLFTALSAISAGKTNYCGLVFNAIDQKYDILSEQVGF